MARQGRGSWNQPAWLHFTSIDHGTVPHHVPYPLVRRLDQIFAWATAEVLEAEETETPQQYAAIAVLDDFPGIDQRRLATLMGLDRTTVGHLVDRLEAKGLLKRDVSGVDRRARELRLTPHGKKTRQKLRPKVVKAQAQVLSPLAAAEQDMLIDLLIRIVKANEVNARPGAGRRKPRSRQNASG
ncbi:MAG: MarR family winged helix-turn-helix transcriptional regulator [Xanthobacteraceae bacterium]